MSMKELSFKDFQKILKRNNHKFIRKNGSHYIYHGPSGRQLVINDKPRQMTLYHLIKEHALIV